MPGCIGGPHAPARDPMAAEFRRSRGACAAGFWTIRGSGRASPRRAPPMEDPISMDCGGRITTSFTTSRARSRKAMFYRCSPGPRKRPRNGCPTPIRRPAAYRPECRAWLRIPGRSCNSLSWWCFCLREISILTGRFSWTDAAIPRDPDPTWYGHSIAKWEGDTLVVDSIGFNDKFWFDFAAHPHTEKLHITERYRRPDYSHLDYRSGDRRSRSIYPAVYDVRALAVGGGLGNHRVHLQREQPGRRSHRRQRYAEVGVPALPGWNLLSGISPLRRYT